MSTPTTRSYVRHCGDIDTDWLLEQEAKAEARQEALLARQEAFRAEHPELAKTIETKMNRRGR